ncbi:MAG: hypothetical protein NUW21_04815, partial [Elusimicrobia bacterium]|nr:hypothetical protein [Elusimicrobiota bacterium]
MMRKLSAGAGFAAVLLLAGCFSQPVRVDPLSGIASTKASTPYRSLSIVLVPSANSEASRTFLRGRLAAHFLPERIFDVMDSIFAKHFGKVMKAADAAEGKKMDSDLVAVLDIFTKFDGTPKYEVAAIFLDSAGQPIETVSAKAAAVAFSAWDAGGLLRSVEQKIQEQFETNLLSSAKLQAIARAHVPFPPGSAPAPIASAVPPELIFHSDVDIPGYSLKENPDDFAF